MRYKTFLTLGLFGLLLPIISCDLQAPPTTTNNNNNVNNKDRDARDSTKNNNEEGVEDNKEFTPSSPDVQGDGSGGLKIVQAPDLTKDKDNCKSFYKHSFSLPQSMQFIYFILYCRYLVACL